MTDIYLSLLLLTGHITFATVLLRYLHSLSPIKIHVLSSSIFAVGFTILGLGLIQKTNHGFNVWPGLSIMSFGSMVFLFAYSGIYKSISLRILVGIAESYPNEPQVEVLYQNILFSKFSERVDLLGYSNLINKKNDKFTASKKAISMCSIFDYFKRLLGFTKSGLYYSSK